MSHNTVIVIESNKRTKKLYACALLSDGELLFWRISDWKRTVHDFRKDFMYSRHNQLDYFDKHKMSVATMSFEFDEEVGEHKINNYVFRVLAREYFKLYPISKDCRGDLPYVEDEL